MLGDSLVTWFSQRLSTTFATHIERHQSRTGSAHLFVTPRVQFFDASFGCLKRPLPPPSPSSFPVPLGSDDLWPAWDDPNSEHGRPAWGLAEIRDDDDGSGSVTGPDPPTTSRPSISISCTVSLRFSGPGDCRSPFPLRGGSFLPTFFLALIPTVRSHGDHVYYVDVLVTYVLLVRVRPAWRGEYHWGEKKAKLTLFHSS